MENIIVRVDEATKGLINHLQSELTEGLNQQLRNIQSNLNHLVDSSSKDLILSIQEKITGIHQTLKNLDESFKDTQGLVEDIESDTSGLSSSIKNLNVDTLSSSIQTLREQLQALSNLSSIVETISFNKQILLDEQSKSSARDANISSLEKIIIDNFQKNSNEIKSETLSLSNKLNKNSERLSLLNELLNQIENHNIQRDKNVQTIGENLQNKIESHTEKIKGETLSLSEKVGKNAEALTILNELLNQIENHNIQRDKSVQTIGENLQNKIESQTEKIKGETSSLSEKIGKNAEALTMLIELHNKIEEINQKRDNAIRSLDGNLNEKIDLQTKEIKSGQSSLITKQNENTERIETKIFELQNAFNQSMITEVTKIKQSVDNSQKAIEERLSKIDTILKEMIASQKANQETNVSWFERLHDLAFRILYTVTPFWKKKKLDEDN